jgi:hypothetical protein
MKWIAKAMSVMRCDGKKERNKVYKSEVESTIGDVMVDRFHRFPRTVFETRFQLIHENSSTAVFTSWPVFPSVFLPVFRCTGVSLSI